MILSASPLSARRLLTLLFMATGAGSVGACGGEPGALGPLSPGDLNTPQELEADADTDADTDADSDTDADTDADSDADADHCADHSDQRNVYFGDLHVHTSWSFDAYAQGNTQVDPEQALAFARGEEVPLAPFDASGKPISTRRLETPLDFAAITDHAEYQGFLQLCMDPSSSSFATETCTELRLESNNGVGPSISQFWTWTMGDIPSPPKTCEEDDCDAAAADVWERTVAAGEAATTPCTFTAFHGYEWSDTAESLAMMHRNVIFGSSVVPQAPVSVFDAPNVTALYEQLEEQCGALDDCLFLGIPHNPNLSSGLAIPENPGVRERQLRTAHEPLLEIIQHKGSSECAAGSSPDDPDCEWAQATSLCQEGERPCGSGESPSSGCSSCLKSCDDVTSPNSKCFSERDFARGALGAGMHLERSTGDNPYQFGFVGGSDTHKGTPGLVREETFFGHSGWSDDDVQSLIGEGTNAGKRTPGGLTAIWAEENTREHLFEALERREVYATSGTRIALRFYAGELPEDICDSSDLAATADAAGVPMGGQLSAADGSPRFALWAMSAPHQTDADGQDVPGQALERLQIVKVWVDESGSHEAVYDVAGERVDTVPEEPECAPIEEGEQELCGVWEDPDFDPEASAAYYARVFEVPSCNLLAQLCNQTWSRGTDYRCSEDPAVGLPMAKTCCSLDQYPHVHKERAWSSAIWVTPVDEDTAAR